MGDNNEDKNKELGLNDGDFDRESTESLPELEEDTLQPDDMPELEDSPAIDIEKIKTALMGQFPDDQRLVESYLELILANASLMGAKVRRTQTELPASVVKMGGQHFLFDKKLGKGYCATAKKAIHLETGQILVIKIIKPSQPILSDVIYEIAKNEQRILEFLGKNPFSWSREINLQSFSFSSLMSNNNLFRALFSGKKVYMTQPLEEGSAAEDYCHENTFSMESAKTFISSILQAMKKLHDKGVFHGDIKLENIIFDPAEQKSAFIDFGLSQIINSQGLVENNQLWMPHHFLVPKQLVGLFHQECPEWTRGETLGLDSDIYALGLTLNDFIQKAKIEGNQEEVDQFKKDIMQNIIEPMLNTKRDQRPTIDALLRSISAKPLVEKM